MGASELLIALALWLAVAWMTGTAIILAADWYAHGVDRSYLRSGTGEAFAFILAALAWPLWAPFALARRLT